MPLHLTVIVALPFLIPLTTPLLVTVATFLLLLVYVTFPAGVALDLIVVVLPFLIVAEDFVRLNVGFLTVSLYVAFSFPLVAVIVTVPAFTPFTAPVLLFTVATFVLLDVYLIVADGVAVAFTVTVFPVYTVAVFLANFNVEDYTDTFHVAFAFP